MHINPHQTRGKTRTRLLWALLALCMVLLAIIVISPPDSSSVSGYLIRRIPGSEVSSVPSRRAMKPQRRRAGVSSSSARSTVSLIKRIQTMAQEKVLGVQGPVAGEFGYATFPVDKVPHWAAMRSPAEWNRRYEEMRPSEFIPVPTYDLKALTIPRYQLEQDPQEGNLKILTAKLFYSTRYFGRYSVDSNEFEGTHPGLDLKLAPGTPVGAIAGGRVLIAGADQYLGNHVMILHILPGSEEPVISIYGHLESHSVKTGDLVSPGTIIGNVGSTGRSSAAHLHVQIDRAGNEKGLHGAYSPSSVPSLAEASQRTIHPIEFIERYQSSKKP